MRRQRRRAQCTGDKAVHGSGLEGLLPPAQIKALRTSGHGKPHFVTVRLADPTLLPDLLAAGVQFQGRIESRWLSTLLSWIVPTLIFVVVWGVFMRRMGPASGLMSLGKSKAKVYVEQSTGMTFDDVAGIDELDALGKARGLSPMLGGHDEREQTLNQLLAEMDGFDTQKGVILLAATNRPEILDPALLRPGRFDRQVVIDRPDLKGRATILRVHTRQVTLAPDVDLAQIAARTPGFVGADLANLVNEAALRAAREGKEAVEPSDFAEAIDRLVAGLERKSRVISPKEKAIVAYHEAGHALVAESRVHADRVAKISIIPRGVAALGYTQQQPTEDRYLMTRTELLDRLDVLLGGRTAEEMIFGDISTGAQDDLQRATDLVRHMITRYGMSAALGLATFEAPRQALFLQVPSGAPREYSEETARVIDAEIQKLLEASHSRVHETLTAQRALLESLGKLLIVHEVVDRQALDQLLATVAPAETPPAPMGQEQAEDPAGASTPLLTPSYDKV